MVKIVSNSGRSEFTTARSPARRLLRLKPASEYLSISPGKLRALIQAQQIPIVKYGGKAPWLIDVRDLDRWIEQNKTSIW
jgi:excisionase family DNA binding protein